LLVKDNQPMKRISIFFLSASSLLLACLTVYAQTSDTASVIRQAVETKQWSTAKTELEKVRINQPALFRDNDYDYLLARIAEEGGDRNTALQTYQTTITNGSALSQYALWHLARFARANGDLVLERERLRKLLSLGNDTLLYNAASLRLAQSFFESSDYPSAISSARLLGTSKNVAISREATFLTGQAYLRDNKPIEAREVFTRLIMQMPDAARPDDFALAAVKELDELRTRTELPAVPLSEVDHLLWASIYQFNRDFGGARVHYQAVIDGNPQSGTVPNATYQIGRGLYLEMKYQEALKVFQRVVDQFPQSQSARDALASLAASYLRLKRVDDAIATYKLSIDRFPDGPNPERPYLNIIDALHEAGRHPEALSWVQQTRARFRNDLGGALALFAQQRIHLAQGAWADVVRDADELSKLPDLGGTRVGGGTTTTEVAFLKALALEQLGRVAEAVTGYLAISDGRNEYYGTRATQRLLAMASNEKARNAILNQFNELMSQARAATEKGQFDEARVAAQSALRLTDDKARRAELLDILRKSYAVLPNYKLPSLQIVPIAKSDGSNAHLLLGEKLFGLGLYDEAMPEIFASRTTASAQSFNNENYTLAVHALKGELPNRAVRFAEQLWKPVPADYVLDVAPRKLVELLYPAPFRDALQRHATPRNVDPRFVLSVIRQESRYQVDVKSVSAARGMMQFIASTANDMATQLKLKNFDQDDLYDPDTAILFGSQYLANLFQQFPNQPQAVAGSYNGGADNLARWIDRSRSKEADRYVPEIGFSQTKDYVYKVMSNYWTYQRFYDPQLEPINK
jgi:soluble lytic murein transglycosylase-like protein/TolA-binding protein